MPPRSTELMRPLRRWSTYEPMPCSLAPDPFFTVNVILIALAAVSRARDYYAREFVAAGGLMSYGTALPRASSGRCLCGRILKGEKPADLPVMPSTKFEFVINLKTAKALGVEVPSRLLAIADEVIE